MFPYGEGSAAATAAGAELSDAGVSILSPPKLHTILELLEYRDTGPLP